MNNEESIINFLQEIINHLDGWHIELCAIENEPSGNKQKSDCDLFEHEWVEQHGSDDHFYGFMWFPIGEKYLKIYYQEK